MRCSVSIKTLGNFPKETDLFTSWCVLQSWGDQSGSVFVFCELILTPKSPASRLDYDPLNMDTVSRGKNYQFI